ncbi:hypothetical protein GF358_01655 [Candidatus Woesearchaeota archaeon]|nr:hypothetical protein [Candidatus Woesearchaeota archaeon]
MSRRIIGGLLSIILASCPVVSENIQLNNEVKQVRKQDSLGDVLRDTRIFLSSYALPGSVGPLNEAPILETVRELREYLKQFPVDYELPNRSENSAVVIEACRDIRSILREYEPFWEGMQERWTGPYNPQNSEHLDAYKKFNDMQFQAGKRHSELRAVFSLLKKNLDQ